MSALNFNTFLYSIIQFRNRKSRFKTLPVVLILVVILSLLGGTAAGHAGGHDADLTESIDELTFTIIAMAAVVGGFVFILLFMTLIMFRKGSKRKRGKIQTENHRLEIIWIIIPAIIISYVAFISGEALLVIDNPPEDAMRIQVIGHQWFWEFQYPDGNISIDELWIEEGQTVVFEVTSDDVIHSFFIPDFNVKMDALPNEVTKIWFNAREAGTYDIFCAEFCGEAHHEMMADLVIFEPEAGRKPYGPPEGSDDGTGPGPSGGKVVDLEILESGGTEAGRPWSLNPSRLDFTQGDVIALKVWNNGSAIHNLTIGRPYNLEIKLIPAGEFAWLNFTLDKATNGTDYWCSIAGHRELGMEGLLFVEGEDPFEPDAEEESEEFSWYSILPALIVIVFIITFLVAMRPTRDAEPVGASEEPTEVEDSEEKEEEAGGGDS
jgi:cytochrome c oxidase subunit II